MEDPIFDPWGTYEGSETPPAPPSSGVDRRPPLARPRRWRPPGTHARAAKSRRAPRPLRIERSEPVEATMRDVVRSHLEALARRLEVSRHEASITDGAQEDPPTIRLRIQPWAGPLAEGTPPGYPELEFAFLAADRGVRARTWVGPAEHLADTERTLSPAEAERHLRAIVLDFVALVLR